MSEEQPENNSRFFFGFFIGGLIGALVIFFLGTKEGKRARKILGEKGKDVLDDLEEKIEDLEVKGKELVKQGEEIKEHVVSEMQERGEELTKAASEKLDSALAHVEKIQEQGLETTSTLRKRIFKNLPKKK